MNRVPVLGFIFVSFFFATLSAQSTRTQKAPNFSLKTENGTSIELAKLKGKVVLVNFWATWCGPCRAEIPDFINAYKTYHSNGLEIVGIALDEEGWEKVQPFSAKKGINYPIVLGTMEVVRDYGNPEAIPTTFFIDQKGNIVGQQVGMLTKDKLEQKIKELLKLK